jgi:hypothetical protein
MAVPLARAVIPFLANEANDRFIFCQHCGRSFVGAFVGMPTIFHFYLRAHHWQTGSTETAELALQIMN